MSWRVEAACREVDPAVFFPAPSDTAAVAAALEICEVCPVRAECAALAAENREDHGVWGGEVFDGRRWGSIRRRGCRWCGAIFDGHTTQKFCSVACCKRASRERRRLAS